MEYSKRNSKLNVLNLSNSGDFQDTYSLIKLLSCCYIFYCKDINENAIVDI